MLTATSQTLLLRGAAAIVLLWSFGALATGASSTGVVSANRSVEIASKISARVVAASVEEGDVVAAGSTLVELDAAELRADLGIAEADLQLARAEASHAKHTLARQERLFKRKSVSKDALDDAKFQHAAAVARERRAVAAVAGAKARFDESVIKAPFAGLVVTKSVEVGQLTQPGQLLLVLEDQSVLKFRTRVKEGDVVRLKTGDAAWVRVDAAGADELEGTIRKVVPSGDSSHTFLVEIELPQMKGVYPGMFGKARFQ